MQLTLRSQLIAGVAALSVSAIAVAPVVQPELASAASRVSSAVNLTAYFQNPITPLIYSAYYAIGNNILSQAELLDPADLYWPDSFYTEDFSFLFAPGYAGAIPDFVNQFSFGGLSAVISNLSGYGNAATAALAALIDGPTSAIWNTPFALITAAGYLAAGQPDLAIAELQAQIIDPLVETVTQTIAVAGYIVDNAIANVGTLIANTIPGLIANTIDTLINGTAYVISSAVDTLGTAVSDLLAGQIEDAWNGAVNGLLGPNGTLGQLSDLTVGIGITEFVNYGTVEDPDEVLTVVIPSLRSDLTTAGQRLGDYNYLGEGGIRNDWFDPFPESAAAVEAPAPAAVAAAAVEAPAAAPVAAPAVEAPNATAVRAEAAADSAAPEVTRPVAGDAAAGAEQAGETAPATESAAETVAADNDAPAAAEKPAAASKHTATRKARAAS